MARDTIRIHSEVLSWARERRGYGIEAAAAKLHFALDKLASLEAGQDFPTEAELRNISHVYRVSAAVFFLEEVPSEGFIPPNDFRRLPDGSKRTFSPELREQIDRVRAQIRYLRELTSLGVAAPSKLDLEIKATTSSEEVARQIRHWLVVDQLSLPSRRDSKRLLKEWIDLIESRGILVSQASGVSITEMRGFCLPDDGFPMIVLNGGDAAAPRLFTLLHELVHLLLGEESVCDSPVPEQSHEVFCNSVAAAVLIPRGKLLGMSEVANAKPDQAWTLAALEELAAPFGVSKEALLRRLVGLGKASNDDYRHLRFQLQQQYESVAKPEGSGSGPRDATILRNLGSTYVTTVLEARNRGLITDSSFSDFIFEKLRWADALSDRLGMPRA